MMHDFPGMGWMMAFMWLFMALIIVLPVVAIVLALRALQRSSPPSGAPQGGSAAATTRASTTPPSPPTGDFALLDDDERRLYDLVAGRGGDIPQGDLVEVSSYSKAKVSRVLDRLQAKGLIVRVRRGMTNRIVLAPSKPVS